MLIEIPNRRTRWRNILRLDFSGPRRPLAIDVGKDAVWVIDLNTNALIASALLTQVTATPAAHIGSSSEFTAWTMPVLIVGVPGLQPLTIGPTPANLWSAEHRYRSSWRKGWVELGLVWAGERFPRAVAKQGWLLDAGAPAG